MTTQIDDAGPSTDRPATDQLIAALRRAGPGLRRVGLGTGLRSMPARLLRRRLFRIPRPELDRIITALEDADVPNWLAGGWGVDALLGEETRPHSDVDLCIRAADADRARESLGRLGYSPTADREAGGPSFPVRTVLRDDRGRTIDLLLARRPADAATDPETGLDLPTLDDDDITLGQLGRRRFPCLSLELQLESHRGYRPARRDRVDMRRLSRAFEVEPTPRSARRAAGPIMHGLRRYASRFRTASALLIVVPSARPLLNELGAADEGLPPHVTVLYPFLKPGSIDDDVLDRLRALFSTMPTPTPTFDRLARFGSPSDSDSDPGLYIAPVDSHSFVALTEAVAEQWPDHPPYRDADVPIVPHLTIHAPGLDFDQAVRRADRFLPFEETMTEVELVVRDHWGRWTTRDRFPLEGGSRDD